MAAIDDAVSAVLGGVMNAGQASRHYSVPSSTLRDRVDKARRQVPASNQPLPQAMPEHERLVEQAAMEVTALRIENERLRKQVSGSHERAPITSLELPEKSLAELWSDAEAENAEKIEKALRIGNFQADFSRENKPIGIAFIGDQHISIGNTVDLRQMRIDAEAIASTDGLYVMLGGDLTDNHIKHETAILAARSQPEDQLKLAKHYIGILEQKLMVWISGNHDYWTNQMAGFDALKRIAEEKKLHYAPHEAWTVVNVGGWEYDIGIRHQWISGGGKYSANAVAEWCARGPRPYDVGVQFHLHEDSLLRFRLHGERRYAIRPSSYQIRSAYSKQRGWNDSTPSCPMVVLYPGERRIVAFEELKDGIVHLNAVRKTA